MLDAVVARAVDFQNVERITGGDFLAVIARAVRIHGRTFLAIERLGQNPGGRSLSDPARPDEEIRVREPILRNCVLERARDVRLSDQIIERLGAIFSGEDLVTHKITLDGLLRGRK